MIKAEDIFKSEEWYFENLLNCIWFYFDDCKTDEHFNSADPSLQEMNVKHMIVVHTEHIDPDDLSAMEESFWDEINHKNGAAREALKITIIKFL